MSDDERRLSLPIIPEEERSEIPLEGEIVLEHPDMIKANEWILENYVPPKRELCIFLPCSKRKPYSESPSHRVFNSLIFSLLPPEKVHIVVFGTCGIVPRELEREYPFQHYSFMLGKCNVYTVKRKFIEMESQRIARYLKKTEEFYERRVAYCIGDFREAMKRGSEISGVEVLIVPKEETMRKVYDERRKFPYGSLFMEPYLQDFCDLICSLYNLPRRKVKIEDNSLRLSLDVEWYVH
jgi:predicted RNA-binding protein